MAVSPDSHGPHGNASAISVDCHMLNSSLQRCRNSRPVDVRMIDSPRSVSGLSFGTTTDRNCTPKRVPHALPSATRTRSVGSPGNATRPNPRHCLHECDPNHDASNPTSQPVPLHSSHSSPSLPRFAAWVAPSMMHGRCSGCTTMAGSEVIRSLSVLVGHTESRIRCILRYATISCFRGRRGRVKQHSPRTGRLVVLERSNESRFRSVGCVLNAATFDVSLVPFH